MINRAVPPKPRTDQAVVTTRATLVADYNPTREVLTIVNAGSGTVYIDFVPTVDTGRAFPLLAGNVMTVYNPTQVYAMVTGADGSLGIIEESN